MHLQIDLTQKVQNLSPDASEPEILSGALEVETLLASGQIDESFAAGLFVLWAEKLGAGDSNPEIAREIITAAQRGLLARSYAKKSQNAYDQVAESSRTLAGRGVSETTIARVTGVDRMTVRKALGKTRGRSSEPAEPKQTEIVF